MPRQAEEKNADSIAASSRATSSSLSLLFGHYPQPTPFIIIPNGSHSQQPSADNNNRSSPNLITAARNTHRNGTSVIIEELQDIKDSLEGRKYLEKHSLLCPPGEPPCHTSLATCLHQISMMSGLQKPVINAIRSVAFLLDELEDTQINETVKEA